MKNKESLISPLIFSVLQVFILAAIYIISRVGFETSFSDIYKSIGLFLIIILAPIYISKILQKNNQLRWFNSIPFLTFNTILVLIPLGFLANEFSFNIGYFIPTFGFLLLIKFIFIETKVSDLKIGTYFIPAIIMGVWSASDIWTTGYRMLYIEGLSVGIGHIDVLFHTSIAQMIKTYLIPSTGLNGIPFIHYHFGSHILVASLSGLLQIPVLKIYLITFPLVIAPLFSYSLIICAINICKSLFGRHELNPLFWWVFIIGFIGVYPVNINNMFAAWSLQFSSESYSFALLLCFLVIAFSMIFFENKKLEQNLKKWDYAFLLLIVPFSVFIIGLSKISVACVLLVAIGYFFLRHKYFKKPFYVISGILTILSFFAIVFVFKDKSISTQSIIQPFDFIKHYTNNSWSIFFLPVYFIWPIIYLFFRFNQIRKSNVVKLFQLIKDKHYLLFDIEVLIIICITCLIPIALLHIPGGSAAYFSDCQKWIALIMILALILRSRFYFNSLTKTKRTVFVATSFYFIGILIYNTAINTRDLLSTNVDIRTSIVPKLRVTSLWNLKMNSLNDLIDEPQKKLDNNLRYKMISELMYLDRIPLPQKKSSLLFISQADTLYWNALVPENISFLAPALTGIASIDGISPVLESKASQKPIYEYYGYPDYQFRKTVQTKVDREIPILMNKVRANNKSNLLVWQKINSRFEVYSYK